MAEQVNHPKHYNQHPNGVECIEVIRHYTCDIANALKYLWRAGLKPEMGKADADKEIEDLKKALWYINDYLKTFMPTQVMLTLHDTMQKRVKWVTGYSVEQITEGYDEDVQTAMTCLLGIGIIERHRVTCHELWQEDLHLAKMAIHRRIAEIEQ